MSDDFVVLDCLDSELLAEVRKKELGISEDFATYRSRLVKGAVERGIYDSGTGKDVVWRDEIIAACLSKRSIPPWQELPPLPTPAFELTRVHVTNETSLGAALRLMDQGLNPLVLNFANAQSPGGGFFRGGTSQEASLCRCSSLYWTLVSDPMYLYHSYQLEAESTDWAIVSPKAPFFCNDAGEHFDSPALVDVISSAAPRAYQVDEPVWRQLLRDRIERILYIAASQNYTSLVLGAWGCGSYGNDPWRTAQDFKSVIFNNFKGQFADLVFAIADWSPQRRLLRPFHDVFSGQ